MTLGSRLLTQAICRLPRSPLVRQAAGRVPQRVMIVASMGYGNMILYLPVLAAIRERFPEARVLVIADRGSDAWQAVNSDAPAVDVIWTNSATMTVREFVRLSGAVRRWQPDTVLLNANGSGNPLWVALMRASGASQRIGLTSGGDLVEQFPWSYTTPIALIGGTTEIEQNLQLVAALGIDPADCPTDVPPFISAADWDRASALLTGARAGVAPLIGLHLTSSNAQPWKRWAPHHFAALATMLRDELGARLVLLGGPGDRDAVDGFPVYREGALDLVGRTASLRVAAAIVAQLDLLVAGDTGLMQAAAALRTPALVITGPTDYTRTLRRSDLVQRVARGDACSPCFFRSTQDNPARCPHRNCLELLDPRQVYEEAKSFLATSGACRLVSDDAVPLARDRGRSSTLASAE